MTKFEKANQRAQFYFELMYRVMSINNDRKRYKLKLFIYDRYRKALNDAYKLPPQTSEQPLNF